MFKWNRTEVFYAVFLLQITFFKLKGGESTVPYLGSGKGGACLRRGLFGGYKSIKSNNKNKVKTKKIFSSAIFKREIRLKSKKFI